MGRPGHWNGGMDWGGGVDGAAGGYRAAGTWFRADASGPDGHDLGRRAFPEERLEAETRVPIPAVGVQDPERGPATRRPGPAACDDDIGCLPDDIAPESDPRPALELQADPRPLPDRGGHAADEAGWLEDEERDARPAGEGGETPESIGELRCPIRSRRHVDDQEVHGPPGQERPGDREALVGRRRRQHDQPFQLHPASHGLHGIEGGREIEPGHDGPVLLRLRGESQRDRRPPARQVTTQREAHSARQPARAEDGVEGREPRGIDPVAVGCRVRVAYRVRRQGRHQSQRPHRRPMPTGALTGRGPGPDGATGTRRPSPDHARGGRSPARLEGRKGCRHVRGEGRHQVPSIEHLFE